MFKKTLITAAVLLATLGDAALAADYYVVTPVKGRVASSSASAIQVALAQGTLPGASVGLSYNYSFSQHLQVTGDSEYTGYGLKWSVSAGSLPAGLVLNSDTGVVSGTPTAAGTAAFTLKATYKTKQGDQSYQIPVSLAVSVALAASTPPQGVVGVAYSYNLKTLLAVAGDPAYTSSAVTWSVVSTTLPAGLYLTTDGFIGGTPTASGSGSITVRAAYKGVNGDQAYQVGTVSIGVTLAASAPPQGLVGQPYSFDLKPHLAVSGDGAYNGGGVTWSVASSTLPAGLYLTAGGVISGTPTAAGSGSLTALATYRGVAGQRAYSVTVAIPVAVGTLAAASGTDFGSVTIGASSTLNFVYSNSGTAPATGVVASVSTATDLAVLSNTCGSAGEPGTVAVGESCSYSVKLTPTSTVPLSGVTTSVVSSSGNSPSSLSLTGTGVQPTIGVSSTTSSGFTALQWADASMATSCKGYANPSSGYSSQTTNGLYWIQPAGQAATAVYCDMVSDGGGWTAVMVSPHDSALTANWATVSAVNWVSGAVADPYTQSGSKYKLADAFINAIPATGGPRYKVFISNGSSSVNRYFSAGNYSTTTCGSAAKVVSYSDVGLSTGAKSSNTVWSSACGFQDASNNGSNYNAGFFVLVVKSGTSGTMNGSLVGAAVNPPVATNRVIMFVR